RHTRFARDWSSDVCSSDLTNTLVELARAANQRGWWTQYRETTPEYFLSFVGQEADAATIWSYQSEWVPGQLQTAAYIEASTRTQIGRASCRKRVDLGGRAG